MRVLFWGTPEFALPALGALLGEGHDVVGVVTQPDRPRGRGQTPSPSPVKEFAEAEGLPVLQPERARDAGFLEEARKLKPELNVVVAYGQILSREALDLASGGSINVHASLLPKLRGAAPIHWAIIRGHTSTGVTTMRMVEALDAGPMLMQVEEPILPEETVTDLTVRLSELGAEALIETLALMEVGGLEERPQDHEASTYAPMIDREVARVDWSRPARQVADLIRGLDAVPGAWTVHNNGPELKVYRPRVADPDEVAGVVGAAASGNAAAGDGDAVEDRGAAGNSTAGSAAGIVPGMVLDVEADRAEEGLLVACGEGAVWVREVKPAGKRRMNSADWLRGRGARAGDRLE
jgi:methionyl-tRNA formyltransferase